MIPRYNTAELQEALANFPVVALLGPRQVGKTTLALYFARNRQTKSSIYIDLELDSDRNKLEEAELFLAAHHDKLVIIDEVQRRPDLFALLRSLVDQRIQYGERVGHFLILGSASRDLLQQSSESLAGRIAYLDLSPFSLRELLTHDPRCDFNQVWLRGGFPGSYLATSDKNSWRWRTHFITTYVERDIPLLGPRLPAERLQQFWRMLALAQGNMLNIASLVRQ